VRIENLTARTEQDEVVRVVAEDLTRPAYQAGLGIHNTVESLQHSRVIRGIDETGRRKKFSLRGGTIIFSRPV
jgi:hypothetical protein